MEPTAVINKILSTFSYKSLNEADTRFKIIDTIILDILKWPKDPIACEVIQKGVRCDYVLYGRNKKPSIIIESKKSRKILRTSRQYQFEIKLSKNQC